MLHRRAAVVYYRAGQAKIDRNVPAAPQLPLPGLTPTAVPAIPQDASESVRAFSAFVQAARAVADDVSAAPAERIRRLKRMEDALALAGPDAKNGDAGEDTAAAGLRRVLDRAGMDAGHALHILQACRKDVTATHYRSWSELLAYCRYAAAPAGRFVFDLCGEGERARRAGDGLFSAWHVLSIVQNCRDDYLAFDRVYLPSAWLHQNGVQPGELGGARSSPGLRRVFAQAIDGARTLIEAGRAEAAHIRDAGLRSATGRSFALADRLRLKIGRRDPLRSKVEIGRWDRLMAGLRQHRP